MGAMDEEIESYLRHLKDRKETEWKIFRFYTGKLWEKDVVIIKTGVGKVFSAMICQHLIDKYNVELVLFTGVGGALNKQLNIGDVVVSIDSVHHDMDVKSLGFERGRIPYTNYRFFKAERQLVEKALKADLSPNKIIRGRILTGEQFFTHADKDDKKYLTEELKGDCIEMEGAAVAQVCVVNEIPHIIIRTITDSANGDAFEDFTRFKPIVASNSFKVVEKILGD